MFKSKFGEIATLRFPKAGSQEVKAQETAPTAPAAPIAAPEPAEHKPVYQPSPSYTNTQKALLSENKEMKAQITIMHGIMSDYKIEAKHHQTTAENATAKLERLESSMKDIQSSNSEAYAKLLEEKTNQSQLSQVEISRLQQEVLNAKAIIERLQQELLAEKAIVASLNISTDVTYTHPRGPVMSSKNDPAVQALFALGNNNFFPAALNSQANLNNTMNNDRSEHLDKKPRIDKSNRI
ncbi:MAG: hypothetical protein WC627_12650 [Legionella sp.]|jgi:hypothetical protein